VGIDASFSSTVLVVNVDLFTALGMLLGLIGILIPLLPGLALIVISAIVWAVADGSDLGEWLIVAAVGAICLGAMLASSLIPARRAAGEGAPRWVLVAGVLGVIVGAIAVPVVGALIGWPAGIFVAEWTRTRRLRVAWNTTRATLVGLGLGIAIQFGAGVVAVSIWAIAAWRW
jgi:uncharacterized protein